MTHSMKRSRSRFDWFRMDVPHRHRARVGKTSWRESLHTTDPTLAAVRRAELSARYKRLVHQLDEEIAAIVPASVATYVEACLGRLAECNGGSIDRAVAGLLSGIADKVRASWSPADERVIEERRCADADDDGIYVYDIDALRNVRAAAIATADLIGWQIDPTANDLLDRRLGDYLVLPDAWALIGPYAGASSLGVGHMAHSQTRSDVLLVAVSPDRTARFVIGRAGRPDWQHGCRLWQGDAGALWFAPELIDVRSYLVAPTGLKDRPTLPWVDTRERDVGFARAALAIAKRMAVA